MTLDAGAGHAAWRALGTYVQLGVADERALTDAISVAAGLLDRIDACASRFRPDSDLTRVNAGAGRWVEVDPLLAEAVLAAIDVAAHTDGLVHPLLGATMVSLGYDRTFTDLPVEVRVSGHRPVPLDSWRGIEADLAGRVRIPAGTALDLGATGKAFAADLIMDVLAQRGVTGIVSVGGDVAVTGEASWPVAVCEHPDEPGEVVMVSAGGLATSSTRVRRWSAAGVALHHLVDPRTGAPAPEVWRTVSATGPSAVAANAATTAAIVLGAQAPGWLAARGVDARLVARDGAVRHLGGWPAPVPVT